MKKIRVIIMALMIFMSLMFSMTVYAGTAYVDEMSIIADINEDGTVTITENILWNVDGDLNGLYRDIIITNNNNSLNGASEVYINEVTVNGTKFNYSNAELNNGDSGAYNLNNIKNGIQVKIFTPTNDARKTTIIKYTLTDTIVKYNDIEEFYWNFIGNGWDYGIDKVDITINLPKESNTLKIYGHGPLSGFSEIIDKAKVKLQVANLRSNEQVDARLVFDKDLVNTTKVVNENMLEKILEQEESLAAIANLKRKTASVLLNCAIVMAIIGSILPIVIYIKAKKKIGKIKFDGKYYRELVEDYGPAIASSVYSPLTIDSNSENMMATLLDLVRKKYVEIVAIKSGKKNKISDYNLKLINDDLSRLTEIEKYYVEELIFKDCTEISLNELKKRNTKNVQTQNAAYERYKKWVEIIKEEAQNKELIKSGKTGAGKYVGLILASYLLVIVATGISIFYEYEKIMIICLLLAFIGMIEVIIVISNLLEKFKLTNKGREHQAMWKAFRSFLLDFSKLDEKGVDWIVIWEHYLVYATSLDVAKKVIKQLELMYPTQFVNDTYLNNYSTFSILASSETFETFNSSFNSAAGAAFSIPSSGNGAGGGFSGGAGAGGGGGGGGGF